MKSLKILYVLPVLVILGYAASSLVSNTQTILPYNYTPEKFQSALASGKPTVLELGADWCKVCIEMMPLMEEVEAEYPDVNFIIANIDVEKELFNKYSGVGTPTFVFYNSAGEEVKVVVGYQSKEGMVSFIKRIAGASAAELSETYVNTDDINPPKTMVLDDTLVVEVTLNNAFDLYGEGVLAYVDGKPLKILSTDPDYLTDEKKITRIILKGYPVKITATLPDGYEPGSTTMVEVMIKISDDQCCGGYRELWSGGSMKMT